MRSPLLAALALVALPAAALADPPPWAHAAPRARLVAPEHDAGTTFAGRVSGIDYARGLVTLDTADRGRVTLTLLPSTIVEGRGPGYRGISDLARGIRVEVLASGRGGSPVAQLIRIR